MFSKSNRKHKMCLLIFQSQAKLSYPKTNLFEVHLWKIFFGLCSLDFLSEDDANFSAFLVSR